MNYMNDNFIQRVFCGKFVLPVLPAKTPITGDLNAFKDHRRRTGSSAFDVMRWLLYWTWIAKKPDAAEFCHTLVCRADGESCLHSKEFIDCFANIADGFDR